MKKYNYHTHTARCFHAKGEDEQYVLAAIEAGFEEIGFADHSPWDFDGYVSHMRMHKDEFKGYCDSINHLKEKYKDKISVKLGLECEYFPKYMPWLKEKIEEYGIDYLILGHHFGTDEPGHKYNGDLKEKEDLEIYKNDILEALDTGLFSYVAHPDIFMRGYDLFDEKCEEISRAIIKKAIETDTPLEYNLLGFKHSVNDGKEGYPYPDFWALVSEYKPKAVVGIDAHSPESFFEEDVFRKGYENLAALGIEVTDKIRFFR